MRRDVQMAYDDERAETLLNEVKALAEQKLPDAKAVIVLTWHSDGMSTLISGDPEKLRQMAAILVLEIVKLEGQ